MFKTGSIQSHLTLRDKIFSLEDKQALLTKVDRNVLIRVSNEIMAEETPEEVKKN